MEKYTLTVQRVKKQEVTASEDMPSLVLRDLLSMKGTKL